MKKNRFQNERKKKSLTLIQLSRQNLFLVLYWKRSPLRHVFCVLGSSLQLYGAVLFAGAEVVNNFPSTVVDRNFEFTFDHCFYFWFAYGANYIWVVIPVYIIVITLRDMKREAEQLEGKKKK